MGVAALMLTSGIFLVVAGIRNESVPAIIAAVVRGEGLGPLSVPVNTNDPRTGTPMPPNIPGQITIGGTIGSGDVGRSGRAPA